jgi:hypothetical protein
VPLRLAAGVSIVDGSDPENRIVMLEMEDVWLITTSCRGNAPSWFIAIVNRLMAGVTGSAVGFHQTTAETILGKLETAIKQLTKSFREMTGKANECRTLDDLAELCPDLGKPIITLLGARANFDQPVTYESGCFSRVDLSGSTRATVDMHVGFRTKPSEARILIRESALSPNRLVFDKTANGWRVSSTCDEQAQPWLVALVHKVFEIDEQDCAKGGGKDHRGRHDLAVSEIDEHLARAVECLTGQSS